jgi:hypothetical protein
MVIARGLLVEQGDGLGGVGQLVEVLPQPLQ